MFNLKQIEELKSEINYLNGKVKSLVDQLKAIAKEKEANEPESMVIFNFNLVDVLSIERIGDKTNIGYYVLGDANTLHEWQMKTSIKQHNELVKQFEEFSNERI